MAGITKYHTVLQQLEAMIQSGVFADRKLPSEPELAERFKVSRSVIRQAYSELEKRGAIERKAGSGTTLQSQLPKKDRIISMTDQIRDAGMIPSTRVARAESIFANQAAPWVQEAFGLTPDTAPATTLYYIDRLRCGYHADRGKKTEVPWCRQQLWLLAEQFPDDLLATTDFEKSIFAVYARYGRFPARAEEIMSAHLATKEEARLLKMKWAPAESRLCYRRRRITWDFQDRVLEVMDSLDRGDFFRSYRYSIQGAERVHPMGQQP